MPSDPFVGEIMMFAGNFAPAGWAFCNGQLLSIAQNSVLFNLIGTIYGGDGVNTFALPDLQGRVPLHAGQGPSLSPHTLGEKGGAEGVSLTLSQVPQHNHPLLGSALAGNRRTAAGNVLAADATGAAALYSNAPPDAQASPQAVGSAGGGAGGLASAHENRMPYLAVNYVISLFGIYPTQ
jgi:microcystin-dependent protein